MLDPRIPDGLADVLTCWTLDDIGHAWDMLDQLDVIDATRARQRAAADHRRGRHV